MREMVRITLIYPFFCSVSGYFNNKHSPTFSIMAIFWWFYIIVIMSTFSANLIAFLAIDIRQPPFETLEELADDSFYKIGTVGSSIWEDEMKVFTNTGIFRQKCMLRFLETLKLLCIFTLPVVSCVVAE